MPEERAKDDGEVYQNPTGVDCQDCPFRGRWYPPEGSEHPHKHDLATDHEVEYVDADEIRESVDYEGRVVAVHDEQATLVTDGGTEIPPWVDPNDDLVLCHFCGQEWRPTEIDGFDLSQGDEYYPNMVPVCPEHAAGGCR